MLYVGCYLDAFGPTRDDPTIDSIVCSLETEPSCHDINVQRRLGHLNPMHIFSVSFISNTTNEEQLNKVEFKVSSTFLRYLIHELDDD